MAQPLDAFVSRPTRAFAPGYILFCGTLFVFAFTIANKKWGFFTTDELVALFTGLGFVGILATLRHEREKTLDQAKVMQRVTDNLLGTTHALNDQALLAKRTAFIHALTARIEAYSHQQKIHNSTVNQRLIAEQHQLMTELDTVLNQCRKDSQTFG